MKDTVFQCLLKPLTSQLIAECSRRFQSDYHYEKFLTWQHLQTMIYAHLNEIKSLNALEIALNSQQIGVNCLVKRSTISDANQRRPVACFIWILEQLMQYLPRQTKADIGKVVKLLDSSPIQLKGRGYDEWASEHSNIRCQGLKLHVEYDLQLASPTKLQMTHPNKNDVCVGKQWSLQADTIYVFDKGYYDFNWWWKIHQQRAYFVTRLKKQASIRMESNQYDLSETILENGIFRFKNTCIKGRKANLYQENLRRISVYREGKAPLILVTNLHDLPAETIAALYKSRWEIELFFKWIKQNLKLKKYLGKSANAVKIQIVTALITYILIQLYQHQHMKNKGLRVVLTWVRYNLPYFKQFEETKPPTYLLDRRGGLL